MQHSSQSLDDLSSGFAVELSGTKQRVRINNFPQILFAGTRKGRNHES
jgi:hypothetical protein